MHSLWFSVPEVTLVFLFGNLSLQSVMEALAVSMHGARGKHQLGLYLGIDTRRVSSSLDQG